MTQPALAGGAESLGRLVHEASELRDYLLRVEGIDGTGLDKALRPFEKVQDPSAAKEESINILTSAFQGAFDAAYKTIDRYTLSEVLKGRSPFKTRSSFWGNFILTFVGIILVISALYYTNWSNRTSHLIEEAKRFSEFQHYETINKLIELQGLFVSESSQSDPSNKEVALFYQETEQALKSHYLDEFDLPKQLLQKSSEVSPFIMFRDALHRRTCPDLSQPGSVEFSTYQMIILCPLPNRAANAQTAQNVDEALRNIKEVSADGEVARNFRLVNEELQEKVMERAERQIELPYQASRRSIFTTSERLKGSLNNIHTWALPIIYGMLGSIIYCMWRVLNPNLAAVGFTYTIIRTAFAGLAALTLSMLLIPSNVLSIGIDLHRPFIYLLSFIFGYSVEAFVSTLSLLNTYFSSNLTPRRQTSES